MKKQIKFKDSKILLLCTTDNMIWQFLIPHIQDLIAFGAKVDCVCHKTGFWFDELKETYGFNMINLDMKRNPINLTNFKAYQKLKKLHKKNQYDLIYCQQPTGGMLGRFIGKKFKLPVIYTAHGFFFFKGNNKLKNFVFRTAEKIMAKHTDVLLTINEEDFQACKKWTGGGAKFKIHGIGLDFESRVPKKSDISLCEELSIEKTDKIVLSVSEFTKNKNHVSMLKAVAKVMQVRQDVKYVLCGTGEHFEEMKKLAEKLGIEKNVFFLGYRKDVLRIMEQSDIFLHQSFREGLTVSIMEAMSFGLPIVASKVRGNADLVDEKGGFLTNPTDIEAQAAALNELIEKAALRESMGRYNQEAVKRFRLEAVREELKQIYKENGLI